jgi:tripeptidyl-peptidase-1
MFSLLFALCALAVFAAPLKSSFSSFSSSARVAMESEARNKHWTLLRSHSAHSAHSLLLSSRLHILQFWLHAQNASGVERELSLRSDPHCPLFRHWLSVDEANKFLLPKNEHLERVLSWIDTFDNIRNVSVSLNVVFVETTVGVAEKMLATKFGVFSHKTHSDVTIVRAIDSYSLPADIAEAVAFVGGVRHFPRSVPKIVATKKRSPEFGVAITPRIIHERYGSVGVANKAANNSQAVAQFLGQVFREADLQEFFLLHSPENIGRRPTIIGPDGGLFGGTEAELDIQYIFAVGQSVSTIFWSTPGLKDGQEPFLTWINAVAAYRNPPLVNSVSYGDDEDSLSVR